MDKLTVEEIVQIWMEKGFDVLVGAAGMISMAQAIKEKINEKN